MVVFPNAKINLGLDVLNKRDDGYHNLESIFYPVGLCDVLEVIRSEQFSFSQSGITIPGPTDQNLVVMAYQLFNERYAIGPVAIHLHKVIPAGSGLGGGSSDAAHLLLLLNKLFELRLPTDALADLALQLGSDCPFFLLNQPCLVKGRGEYLFPVSLDLSGRWIKIVHSGIHVSTREAFANITPGDRSNSYEAIDYNQINTFFKRLENDFEKSLFPQYAILAAQKKRLLDDGALYASMTGSGSAIYGIFDQEPSVWGDVAFEYTGKL